MHDNLQKLDPKALPADQRIAIASVFACLVQAGDTDSNGKGAALKQLFDWLGLSADERQAIKQLVSARHDPTTFAVLVSDPVTRSALLWDLLSLAILDGSYDSRDREGIRLIATAMGVPWEEVVTCEDALIGGLREVTAPPTALAESRPRVSNRWKIAAAALGGGVLLAVTGGLAAPAIGGAIGTYFMGLSGAAAVSAGLAALGGGAVAAGGLGMAGGAAAVATLLGAGGAALAGYKMNTLTGSVDEFELESLGGDGAHVMICVSGWLSQEDDFTGSWSALSDAWPHGERLALRWESKHLRALGLVFAGLAAKNIGKAALEFGAKRASRAAATALTWPLAVVQAMDLIDNPWHVAADRAKKVGIELGRVLRERVVGRRPVSLYGFSLGARVIFHALEELSRTGSAGIIDHAVLLGAAVTPSHERWREVRRVVHGRLVNAYCESDWVLAYLYRPAELASSAAGLERIDVEGVESVDVGDIVGGHIAYRSELRKVLQRIGIDGTAK